MRKVSHDVVRTRVARHRDDGRHRVELADQRRRRDACELSGHYYQPEDHPARSNHKGSWHGARNLPSRLGIIMSCRRKRYSHSVSSSTRLPRGSPYKQDTHHQHEVIFLRIHLVDRTDAIDSDVDLAPKLFQKLGTQFPTDGIVLDEQHARRDSPTRHGRLATTDRRGRRRRLLLLLLMRKVRIRRIVGVSRMNVLRDGRWSILTRRRPPTRLRRVGVCSIRTSSLRLSR